jgi:hypothetical protein
MHAVWSPNRIAPGADERIVDYAQVKKLLMGRASQRNVVRVTSISRTTMNKLAKNAGAQPFLTALAAEKSPAPEMGKTAVECLPGRRTRHTAPWPAYWAK